MLSDRCGGNHHLAHVPSRQDRHCVVLGADRVRVDGQNRRVSVGYVQSQSRFRDTCGVVCARAPASPPIQCYCFHHGSVCLHGCLPSRWLQGAQLGAHPSRGRISAVVHRRVNVPVGVPADDRNHSRVLLRGPKQAQGYTGEPRVRRQSAAYCLPEF